MLFVVSGSPNYNQIHLSLSYQLPSELSVIEQHSISK